MFNLAVKNLTRRLASSAASALIVAIATFAIVASAAVVWALDSGVELSRQRLGADIMVLPAGASASSSQVLFTAAPVNVYLPSETVEAVSAVPGVARASAQFFTQTVDESCCSVVGVTRVVGIDASSDFAVTPWLEEAADPLGEDGIIVGAAAPRIEGGQASILGDVFYVRGYLEPTGASMDETIFMDIAAARRIAMASPYLTSVWEGRDASQSVSCVMVALEDGYDSEAVAQAIVDACPGTAAVSTSAMVGDVAHQLDAIRMVALVMLALLVALAAVAFAGRVSAIARSRMPELGLLRTMGAGRGSIAAYLACEVGLLTLCGALVGAAAGVAGAHFALDMLRSSMQLPVATGGTFALSFAFGILFALVLGTVCLVAPLARVMRTDPIKTLTKGSL